MIDHRTLERYSKLLFSFPSWYVVFGTGILISIFFSYLSGWKMNFTGFFLVSIFFFYLITRFFGYALYFSRAVVFSFITLVIALTSWIIERSFIFSSLTSFILISLYFSSRSENGFLRTFILAGVYPLLLIPFSNVNTTVYILFDVIGLISGILYLSYFSRERPGILKPERILRSFLIDWLFHDPEPFEKEILKHSIEVEGNLKSLKSQSFSILQSTFHPGPIRSLGGGKLVNEILRSDGKIMYVHSLTRHSLNPSTSRDVSIIKRGFLDLMGDDGLSAGDMGIPVEVEGKYFTGVGIPFERLFILIIQKKGFGPDDIPEYLYSKLKQHFMDYEDVIVIDSHNSEPDHDVWNENYERDILEMVSKIKVDGRKAPTMAGYSYRIYSSRSVCDGGIRVGIIKSIKSIAFVSIDANGMNEELRSRIAGLREDFGIDMVIPMTTDNHSKIGVGALGGHPAGYSREEVDLIEKLVREALTEAIRKMKKVEFRFSGARINVMVMGEKMFQEINSILTERVPKYIMGFILSSFFPVILQGVVL